MRLPSNPTVYEVHTAAFLHELSAQNQTNIFLDTVPDEELDRLMALGIDAVWLMGVWQRSQAAVDVDGANDSLQAEFRNILPDFFPHDSIGSAYAVKEYAVDARFGGNNALARLRERLAQRSIGIILDFVPNHTAPDHAWAREHTDYYIYADAEASLRDPVAFMSAGDLSIAKGRDPNSAPWPDTLQTNAFSPSYRIASIETLRLIATMSDGVRCDMAMLMLDDVVARTWGELAGAPQPIAYWPEVISAVREQYPDLKFIAECYWDTERTLIQQGFDYCYDKTFYDHLIANDPIGAKEHLGRTADVQTRMVHFIENHDEPRIASILSQEQSFAAGALAACLPGASLVHAGQVEGKRVKIPVQLARGPEEVPNVATEEFYQLLLGNLKRTDLRNGAWSLVSVDKQSVIAYEWERADTNQLIVVNYSADPVTASLSHDSIQPQVVYSDQLGELSLRCDQTGMLEVPLGPWQVRHLAVTPDVEQ